MATQVVFSSDVTNLDLWARRTRIPLTNAEALGATYARAHGWLNHLKLVLVRDHGWVEVPSPDSRILFSLETPSIRKSSVNVPAGPKLTLQLPVCATSFFTPHRRVQWQMVFHSDIFDSVRKICPPINDILYLIQCLLTGLVTVVLQEQLDDGVYRTTRGLPPPSWFADHYNRLAEIFDSAHLKGLRRACNETSKAYHLHVKLNSLDQPSH